MQQLQSIMVYIHYTTGRAVTPRTRPPQVKRWRAPPSQISYGLLIERSTSRASERTSERANERASETTRTVAALCLPCWDCEFVNRCDTSVEEVIKRINVLSLLSLIIILGRSPRSPSGIYFPAPTSHWRTSPSEDAHRIIHPSILPH